MMKLFAIVLVGVALAQQASGACPPEPNASVAVVAQPDSPIVSQDLSLTAIKELFLASGQKIPHEPLGFYTRSIRYVINIATLEGDVCADRIMIGVTMMLQDRRIIVAPEVMARACLRDAALSHYQRHASANAATFMKLAARTQSAFAAPKFLEALRVAGSSRVMQEKLLKAELDAEIILYQTEDRNDQAAVDTTHEVEQLGQACDRPV